MLEVGSLAEVEATLRARGFFEGGAQGLVADVFLGYGLSNELRREAAPPPPEPCPLPLAAVRVREAHEDVSAPRSFSVGGWVRK